MNFTMTDTKKQHKVFDSSELCGTNFRGDRSAFIGVVALGNPGLYLITYQGVSKANDPSSTWARSSVRVEVDRFVDINITIVERDDDE